MTGPHSAARIWIVVFAIGAACISAWNLPAPKPQAVIGRLNYPQFLLALTSAGLLASSVMLALTRSERRQAIGFRIAATWLGLCIALFGWEVATVLIGPGKQTSNPWYLTSGTGIIADSELPFVRPAHLQWRGLSRGDLATLNDEPDPYACQVEFVTDRQGFRNRNDAPKADLVFVGDSFTEAGNIPDSDTFVQMTGAALRMSVRNLGRAGYTAPTELIVLKKYGLECQPRCVVWQVAESNDLAEAVNFGKWVAAGRPPFPGMVVGSGESRSPTWQLFCRLRTPKPWPSRGSFTSSDGQIHDVRFFELPTVDNSPIGHPGWPIMAAAFRDGAELLQRSKIPLLIVLLPMKVRGLAPGIHFEAGLQARIGPHWDLSESQTMGQHLKALFQELGVDFLDATPALRSAAARGELVYLPMDTHLSKAGHRVITTSIVGALKRLRP